MIYMNYESTITYFIQRFESNARKYFFRLQFYERGI